MQCIRLHWRRSVQGESRWLFFLCPTGSGQTESSGQYIFRPDPSGEALSDGRDNAQTLDPCCHGQANHCFRPDKCVKNRRGHTVHASALKMLFLLKQIIQIKQYAANNTTLTIKYKEKLSSGEKPNPHLGIINTIKPKQPILPICSKTSTNLFFQRF